MVDPSRHRPTAGSEDEAAHSPHWTGTALSDPGGGGSGRPVRHPYPAISGSRVPNSSPLLTIGVASYREPTTARRPIPSVFVHHLLSADAAGTYG